MNRLINPKEPCAEVNADNDFTHIDFNTIKDCVKNDERGLANLLSYMFLKPVKRVIQREVLNQLSKEILAGKVTTDRIILLDCFDGQLVFRNQNELN